MVPYKFKELMEKDELYPPGWCHRKFFAPKQPKNTAKQPRKDSGIVEEVLREVMRKEGAKNSQQADQEVGLVPSAPTAPSSA